MDAPRTGFPRGNRAPAKQQKTDPANRAGQCSD